MKAEQVIGIVSFVVMLIGVVEVRIRQAVSNSEAVQAERHPAIASTVDRMNAAVVKLTEYVQDLGNTIAEFKGRIETKEHN